VLSADRSVEPATIDRFAADGHVLVEGLATAQECAAFKPEIDAAVDRWYPEPRPMAERSTYEQAFLQAMALRSMSDTIRHFVDAPRFARVAAELMGVDAVRLYHDQALYKEPGGGPTPWHQDQNYWPLDTDDTITMWMPLVDLTGDNASMTFVDGSHRDGDVAAGEISDESHAAIAERIEREGRTTTTHGLLRAGDATFHRGWTLHRAPANTGRDVRPVMTIIYFADGARITEPTRDEERFDLATWLDGGEPGTVAAGTGNPRLWPPA